MPGPDRSKVRTTSQRRARHDGPARRSRGRPATGGEGHRRRGHRRVAVPCEPRRRCPRLDARRCTTRSLAAGRSSVASFPEPFVVAPHYRDLPGLDLLTHPAELPPAPPLVVTFDCGALGRLGSARPVAESAGELIVIDHHVSNERYGSINVINPKAAASGVVVRELIEVLGLPLSREVAFCLYVALVCDTGRFQYETTTPEVFALAGELLAFDLPVSELSRTLFEEHSFAYLALLGEALASMTLVREQSFVWTSVTQEQLIRHGVTLDEVEGLIDIVRRTAEADVACVLKEDSDGDGPGEPAIGRRDRRAARRRRARWRRAPVRGRIHLARRHRRHGRPHPRVALKPRLSDDRRAARRRQAGGWTSHDVVAKLRGRDPPAPGRARRHARPRRHRRAPRGARARHPPAAIPAGDDQGLSRCRGIRDRDQHAGRGRRGAPARGDARLGGRGAGRDHRVPGRHRADPADGVRAEGRTASGSTSWRARARRSIGWPGPSGSTASIVEAFAPGPFPTATVVVECSSGTYIRSLAADLGTALGGCAHLASLRRLRVGSFTARGGASARGGGGRPGAVRRLARGCHARPGARRDRRGDERARSRNGTVFTAAAVHDDGPGTVRHGRRPRASCTPCTNGAARGSSRRS